MILRKLLDKKKENDYQLKQAPDCQINSPFQNLKKCIMNSMKNMHTDVRVKMINLMTLDGILTNLNLSNY